MVVLLREGVYPYNQKFFCAIKEKRCPHPVDVQRYAAAAPARKK